MKAAIAIFLVLGVFLIFNTFVPYKGYFEVTILIVVIGLALGAYSAVKRSVYDPNLKPLRCPKCLESEAFRIFKEDAEHMRYQRKCRKCGFVDSYDFIKDEDA